MTEPDGLCLCLLWLLLLQWNWARRNTSAGEREYHTAIRFSGATAKDGRSCNAEEKDIDDELGVASSGVKASTFLQD